MDVHLVEAFAEDPLRGLPEPGSGAVPPVRLAWAAPHVVMLDGYRGVPRTDGTSSHRSSLVDQIDWETTAGLRRRLDRLGLGVAEAMDTAQRSQIGWTCARRLIESTASLETGLPFVAGAGSDSLPPAAARPGMDRIVEAVVEQARMIRDCGGIPILLPIESLVASRSSADTYVEVYGEILDALEGPVLVHWLGSMFAPKLDGYFPEDSFERVMRRDPEKIRGAKLSLLDAEREREIRRLLARNGQFVLTGDDYNFVDLIEGETGPPGPEAELAGRRFSVGTFSHALLGVLDAVARPAAAALEALARGEVELYQTLLRPCEEFARVAFEPPVPSYKASLAFITYLDGLQPNPMVVDHLEESRSKEHYLRAAELAARAGAFVDPGAAFERLRSWAAATG